MCDSNVDCGLERFFELIFRVLLLKVMDYSFQLIFLLTISLSFQKYLQFLDLMFFFS